jgi:hypothetical protein
MKHDEPYEYGIAALYEAVVEKFAAKGTHDRSTLWPWTAEADNEMNIEDHRRRYWDVTPYNEQERAAILKRWTETVMVRGEPRALAEFDPSSISNQAHRA